MDYSISFQGGGAKVIDLVACAEAIETTASRVNKTKIVRVSGTSAGAIAAAMYATGCDFRSIVASADKLKKKANEVFGKVSPAKSFFNLTLGNPLVSEQKVKELISLAFSLGGVNANSTITTLMQDPKARCDELRVLFADLVDTQTEVHNETSVEPLVNALMDSCAIPFLFRTAKSNNAQRIDGGMFQNLPGKYAVEGLDNNTIPIAVVFEKEADLSFNINNSFQYAGLMIDRIISERMKDSALYFQSENIIQISSSESSMSFKEMFAGDFQSEYTKKLRHLETKIGDHIIGNAKSPEPDYHSSSAPDLIYRLNKMEEHASDFSNKVIGEYSAKKMVLAIKANSLANPKAPDIVSLKIQMNGSENEGRQFFRLLFYDSMEGALRAPKITAEIEKNGRKVSTNVLSIPMRQESKRCRPILVCLENPLASDEILHLKKVERSFGVVANYKNKYEEYWQSCIISEGKVIDELILEHFFPDGSEPISTVVSSEDKIDPEINIPQGAKVAHWIPTSVESIHDDEAGGTTVKAIFTGNCEKDKRCVAGIRYIP